MKQLSDKNGFNFFRKIWHILGLIIPISLYLDPFQDHYNLVYASRAVIVTGLGIFLFLLLLVEIVRLNSVSFEAFFFRYFGFLMKESERSRFNGTVPYFLANFIVVLLFPPEIAVLSILFLVIGDPTAAYIGSRYGKHRFYNGKSKEGVIGFSSAAFLVGVLVLGILSFTNPDSFLSLFHRDRFQWEPLLVLFLGVVSSCLTEFYSSTTAKGLIDDNLLIPIVGAVVLSVSSLLFLYDVPRELIFNPVHLYLQK
ncbi:diacylglycerol/polyprenol kinase family protein [Leptospira idonii]|uniref:diacylglycerol/polyprenol kinase family protein n=1 Tax=Leptospira idonii TaxID=1193500 RepID=UPI001FE46281|nr:dolichol kinase [Leptospira idonii]